jgi:hypothetical protein
MRGADPCVSVRDEAALFQRYAVVSGLLVSEDRAGVPVGFQKLPDQFVKRDSLRTGQINHAVQRFRHRHAGNGRSHFIGNDRLIGTERKEFVVLLEERLALAPPRPSRTMRSQACESQKPSGGKHFLELGQDFLGYIRIQLAQAAQASGL